MIENFENSEKKNVVIIGARLVGTNLAYYLSESGNFNVTIFEKESENAARTSFGNAGLVSKSLFKILDCENSYYESKIKTFCPICNEIWGYCWSWNQATFPS